MILSSISSIACGVLFAAGLAGIVYLLAALRAVAAFARRRGEKPEGPWPPVTVLKPVCGAEPGLYENLLSFCDQDYPVFQVVFGVRAADDPAIPVVRRVIRESSGCDAVLVIGGGAVADNAKVANLAGMTPRAKHDLLVVADSDMRVGRRYLETVASAFRDPRTGAATCLYSGTPAAGLASTLGALYINDWFLPSVLVALSLQELTFCLGATMAVRREALDAIGGFEALAPYLADDYMLGALVARHGYGVRLCRYVVETIVSEAGLRSLLAHELRWARTVRACRPAGYAFSFLGTGAVSLAALFAVASGFGVPGLALFAVAAALRVVLHGAVRRAVRVPGPYAPWLLPFRELLCMAVWAAGLRGRGVRWKGRRLSVRPDGTITTNGARRTP